MMRRCFAVAYFGSAAIAVDFPAVRLGSLADFPADRPGFPADSPGVPLDWIADWPGWHCDRCSDRYFDLRSG
jgi:hypothetical protein